MRSEDNLWVSVIAFRLWVLGVELRNSGMVASTFTQPGPTEPLPSWAAEPVANRLSPSLHARTVRVLRKSWGLYAQTHVTVF